MTSLRVYLSVKFNVLALLVGRVVLGALALGLVLVALGLLGSALGADTSVPTWPTPAPAPTPAQSTPVREGDGYEDHDLFDPAALLDTSTIDDLRTDPEAQCIAAQGVVTPAGACVDAIAVWEHEVSPAVWAELRSAYPRDIDHSEPGSTALRVPAEFVILSGPDGEDVHSVDTSRPVTPMAP